MYRRTNANVEWGMQILTIRGWGLAVMLALVLALPATAADTNGDRVADARRARHPLELLGEFLRKDLATIDDVIRSVAKLDKNNGAAVVWIGPVTFINPELGGCGAGIQLAVRDLLIQQGHTVAETEPMSQVAIGTQCNLLMAKTAQLSKSTVMFVSAGEDPVAPPQASDERLAFDCFELELTVADRDGQNRRSHVVAIRARDVEQVRWRMFVDFLTAKPVSVLEPGEPVPYDMQIVVSSNGAEEVRHAAVVGGKAFIPIQLGEKFSVVLINRGSHDVVAQLLLDGVDVFAFSRDTQKYEFFLVTAGGSVKVPGWHVTNKSAIEFKICDYPREESAVAKALGSNTSRVGMITARFAAAWTLPADQPASEPASRGSDVQFAVGFGDAITTSFDVQQRYISSQWDQVSLCYDNPAVANTPVQPTAPAGAADSQTPSATTPGAQPAQANSSPGESANPSQPTMPASNPPGAQAPPAAQPVQQTTASIVARCEQSVARLHGKFSTGTGFLVAPGILVTNSHVIGEELIENLAIEFPSCKGAERGPVKGALLYEDPARDIAVLKVETSLPPLVVATEYAFQRGEDVLVIGNPSVGGGLTLENAVNRGVMSSTIQLGNLDYYQLGISVNPGNSGGPVLDYTGRVIGVVTLKSNVAEQTAFSIPPEAVQEAITKAVTTKESDLPIVDAVHRAAATFRTLCAANKLYLTASATFISHTEELVQRGGTVQDGVADIAQYLDTKIAPINDYLTCDLAPVLSRVSSDSSLESATRAKLMELWELYRDIKASIESPSGTFLEFCERANAFAERYKRLSSSLAILLNVPSESE